MARRRSGSPLFPRGPGIGGRAFLLVLLAVGIWFADQRGVAVLAAIRGSVDWLLQPLHWVGNVPGNVAEAGGELKNYRELVAENRALKTQLVTAQARLLRLDALEAENRRIRQLVASSSALDEKVLIAEIIATAQSPYRHQITLNKGAADGVYFGQALVDAYGIMGQIIRVNPASSIALLVTDPSHGIPVEINRTGLQTSARGGGDGRVLTLPFLPGNADVKVGDLLVSSGLGGRFPAGYPVGEIFDVRRTTGEHFMQASAYPSARLNQGRQALLVWRNAGAALTGELDPAAETTVLAAEAAAAARRDQPLALPTDAGAPAPLPPLVALGTAPASAEPDPAIPLRRASERAAPMVAKPRPPKAVAAKPAPVKPAARPSAASLAAAAPVLAPSPAPDAAPPPAPAP